MRVMRIMRVVDGYIDWHTGMRRKALSSGEESDGCLKGEIGRAERKPMDEDADLCRCAPKWGDASVQVDVDHARLDTISEKAPFQKVHSTPCLASRASRSLKYYIYIVISCCYACPSTMSSPPSSQWFTLPVELQLTITQLLDNKTLRSLSQASHYNRILCLPAVYRVRSCPPFTTTIDTHSLHLTHIHMHSHPEHMYLVGHHTIIRQAPIFPGSRASTPCVPYPHARYQHRRLFGR